MQDLLAAYDQLYLHFTITGLGGTLIEPGVPDHRAALAQLPELAALAGDPRRVSVRFDPLLFWEERGHARTNLDIFPSVAEAAAAVGIRDIRVSFAQWYGKAVRRAGVRGLAFYVPSEAEQRSLALDLAAISAARGLALHACSQPALAGIPGIRPSSCIDGALFESLHPRREPALLRKDRSQRAACLCTASKDIGSYTQACAHGCVYCYANPKT